MVSGVDKGNSALNLSPKKKIKMDKLESAVKLSDFIEESMEIEQHESDDSNSLLQQNLAEISEEK